MAAFSGANRDTGVTPNRFLTISSSSLFHYRMYIGYASCEESYIAAAVLLRCYMLVGSRISVSLLLCAYLLIYVLLCSSLLLLLLCSSRHVGPPSRSTKFFATSQPNRKARRPALRTGPA